MSDLDLMFAHILFKFADNILDCYLIFSITYNILDSGLIDNLF